MEKKRGGEGWKDFGENQVKDGVYGVNKVHPNNDAVKFFRSSFLNHDLKVPDRIERDLSYESYFRFRHGTLRSIHFRNMSVSHLISHCFKKINHVWVSYDNK